MKTECQHLSAADALCYNSNMSDLLPNAANAVIDPRKLRDYVLSFAHDTGRYKAAFFAQMGYAAADWRRLEHDTG